MIDASELPKKPDSPKGKDHMDKATEGDVAEMSECTLQQTITNLKVNSP